MTCTMPGFAASSKLLQKKWEERQYHQHLRKVQSMRAGLDNGKPKSQPHLAVRLKKIQKEEEKQAEIDRNNQILLQKLTQIMNSQGRLDNWNNYNTKSLNRVTRNKQQEQIALQNLKIAKQLESMKGMYNVQAWENDYQKHEMLVVNMSKTTKDFDTALPTKPAHRKRKPGETYSIYKHRYVNSKARNRRENHNHPKAKFNTRAPPGLRLPTISNNAEAIADNESRLLYKVVKNTAKPDDIIFRTLVRKTHDQRLVTRDRFEDLYDLNLKVELKSVMGKPFDVLLDCLLADKQEDEISEIRYAIMENDPSTLVQILSTKSHSEILRVKKQYRRHVDKTIEGHIEEAILDEECQMLLQTILREDRPWTERVDDVRAMKDAEELYESGEGRFTSDRGKFMRIINERSFAQIRQTMQNYVLVTGGMTVLDSMKEDNCSEDFIATVHVLGRCLSDDPEYWAERMHLSLGRDSPKFINLLLQRSEVDLPAVKKAYKKHYDVSLSQEIEKHYNKDLAPLLQQIVGKTVDGAKESKKPATSQAPPPQNKKPTRRKADTKTASLKDNPLSRNSRPASRLQTSKSLHSNKTNAPQKNGTVKPVKPFDVDIEVERFRKAIDLWKTNEEPLINLLVTRSNAQRQAIKNRYIDKFRVSLADDLDVNLGSEFEEVNTALLMPPAEYDAYCLHDCMNGKSSLEPVLIGILASRSTKELKEMQETYLRKYHGSLESDILENTSGEMGKLLVRILRGPREQGVSINRNKARDNARALSRDRQYKVNPTSDAFASLLALVNPTQLQVTVEEYERLAGQTIIAGIKKARVANGEETYIDLVKAMLDPPSYFAKRAHTAMAGIAVDDAMLVRAIVPRAEIDLIDIKEKYEEKYGKELEEVVDGKCQGNYKALLLTLLREDHQYLSRQSTMMMASRQQSSVSATGSQNQPHFNADDLADKFNGNSHEEANTSKAEDEPADDNSPKEDNTTSTADNTDLSQGRVETPKIVLDPKPSETKPVSQNNTDNKSVAGSDTYDWFSKVG